MPSVLLCVSWSVESAQGSVPGASEILAEPANNAIIMLHVSICSDGVRPSGLCERQQLAIKPVYHIIICDGQRMSGASSAHAKWHVYCCCPAHCVSGAKPVYNAAG